MKKFIISVICALCVGSAFAAGENVATSKAFVDTNVALKQDKIPANSGTAQVLTNTGTAGTVGTKDIYNASGEYVDQKDSLIDAQTMNAAVQNAINAEFKCVQTNPNDSTDCWLVDIFGSTGKSTLPTGYTALEYIESTGTQYIDTNVPVRATTLAEFEYQFVGSENNFVFGQIAGDPQAILGYRSTRIWWFTPNDKDPPITDNDKHRVVFNKNGKVYKDDIYVATRGGFANQQDLTMLLFAERNDHGAIYKGKVKIYNFKLTEGETPTAVRNFIPTRRDSDGEIGMYDTVTNTFFTNSGTGEFVAGPVQNLYLPSGN